LQIQDLWALPLQIVLALVILYCIVGVATLTSFLTMLCVMLICLYIARKQKGIMVKIMACKDFRIKRTNEAVSNMKILKLQASQDQFLQQVGCNKNVFSSWMNFFLELHLMTTCYDALFMSYLKAVMLISTRFMQLMSGD
jgi:ABC-type bacteriocin/lantibiotic exporter with double-glycine peptidase domain